jgi:hypothetical protein
MVTGDPRDLATALALLCGIRGGAPASDAAVGALPVLPPFELSRLHGATWAWLRGCAGWIAFVLRFPH